MSLAIFLIFCLVWSALLTSLLVFFPLQPAENSGPRDVSAVKLCLVPLFDSNRKPGRSSFSVVDCCCPSLFTILSSVGLLQLRLQFPTTIVASLGPPLNNSVDPAVGFTLALALCSFSKNSPLFSLESLPPSGLPELYIVASLLSRMNLNQPLEPLDSSRAAASDQMYRQSLPLAKHHSFQ